MRIHILKHAQIGNAERVFTQIAQSSGHDVTVVDPRDVIRMAVSQLPDAVLARCELDRFCDPIFGEYLAALHRYARFNIPVMNQAAFLLIGQDKYLSHLAVEKMLQQHSFKNAFTPETIRVSRIDDVMTEATPFFDHYGGIVVKPPCSGRGNGIFFVETSQELALALVSYNVQTPILLQQPIFKESNSLGCFRDMRLWVITHSVTGQSQVVDAYYRVGAMGSFLTNVSRGASIERMQRIDPLLCQFAQSILETLGGDVAGIDIARDMEGRYWFEEVNVAFETGVDSIRLLGDQIWREVLRCIEVRVNGSSHGNRKRVHRPS